MNRIVRYIVFVFVVLLAQPIFAQTPKEIVRLRRQRLSRVYMQHVGVGLDGRAYNNLHIGPKLFYGIGSHRNLFNVDVGCKYTFTNPISMHRNAVVAGQYVGTFVSGHINVVRWRTGCVYLGAEMAYHFDVRASYKEAPGQVLADNNIGKSHATASGVAGVRLNRWDVGLYLNYNMAPMVNQKYVFESPKFDYDQVYAQTHERYSVGISLSYLISY